MKLLTSLKPYLSAYLRHRKAHWYWISIDLIYLGAIVSTVGVVNHITHRAPIVTVQSFQARTERLVIERINVDPTGVCNVSQSVSAGRQFAVVKFYGREEIYSFEASNNWLLAQPGDIVAFTPDPSRSRPATGIAYFSEPK